MSESGIKELSQERTREWLASQVSTSTEDEELESIAESSVVDSLDYDYTEEDDTDQNISTMTLGTQIGGWN